MRFRATLESNGKTATGIQVPDEVVETLGAGRKPAVRVSIAGHTYRSTIASRGGRYLLGVSAENRERAGVAAGDELDVELELDTEPREVTVPPDLAALLDRHAEARRFYEGLSTSRRKAIVLGIEGAKTAETRQRRIEKAVAQLREGRST